MPIHLARRTLLAMIPTTMLMASTASAGLFSSTPPSDLDLSLVKASDAGLYRASLAPAAVPIPLRSMQTWTIELHSKDGAPVTGAKIEIKGGMPQHGHGLPTQPEVTKDLGDGRYVIEGVKFNMSGWWTFESPSTAIPAETRLPLTSSSERWT